MQARPSTLKAGITACAFFERLILATEEVGEEAQCDRQKSDDEDVEEHAEGINLYLFACQPQYQQWRHYRRQQGGGGGHTHGEGHVTAAEE